MGLHPNCLFFCHFPQHKKQLVSQKDADGVSTATSSAAPQFSPNTVYLANALPESSLSAPSTESVQVRPPEGAFISSLSFDARVW